MKKLVPILSIALWPLAASWAQLAAPNEMGVGVGHVHLVARDVEAEKRVWAGLGGTPIKIDGIDVVKFPGTFIFITQGVPPYSQSPTSQTPGSGVRRFTTETDPLQDKTRPETAWNVVPANANNEGNVLNHIGFRLQGGKGIVEKLQGQGVKVSLNDAKKPDDADVFTTENMRIDTHEGANQNELVVADHIQFDMPRYARRRALAWYVKVFGVKPKPGSEGMAGEIPGLTGGLIFGQGVGSPGSPDAPLPSMGHTLDHIGFEVKNLEAFCKKLETMGIILEYPYSKIRYKSFASAGIIDPWGASIELTEGLNKF